MIRRALKYLLYAFIAYLLIGTGTALFYRRQPNGNPLPAGYRKGVYHLHSTFSDGSGDWDQISRAAASNRLDFAIITDHGRPNLQSSRSTCWRNGVLMIGGSEFDTLFGHLMAGGYQIPDYMFPPEPQESIDEVRRDGGVTFIAHPFDRRIPWKAWWVKGFTGIEILSHYANIRHLSPFQLLLFPTRYLVDRSYALTSLLAFPRQEIDRWDELNREGFCCGIFALDAHGYAPLSRKTRLPFPSYSALCSILTVYVRLEESFAAPAHDAAALVWRALRAGRFFNAIEALAPANGFDFNYLLDDRRVVPMGAASTDCGGMLVCEIPFPFPTSVRFFRDGRIFHRDTAAQRRTCRIPVPGPGAYRVQVHLAKGPFRKLPWILSNPVFIGRGAPTERPAAAPIPAAATRLPAESFGFKPEKNPASRAAINLEKSGGGEGPAVRLDFTLARESEQNPNFWAALASRIPLPAQGSSGMVFSVRGSARMRFWFRIITSFQGKSAGFQRSFLVEPEWRRVAIPFASCFRLHGSRLPRLDPAQIAAIFFLIDGENSFSGKSGSIQIKDLGLY